MRRLRARMVQVKWACEDATESMRRLNVALAAVAAERADLGEFDNRAHDWMRNG